MSARFPPFAPKRRRFTVVYLIDHEGRHLPVAFLSPAAARADTNHKNRTLEHASCGGFMPTTETTLIPASGNQRAAKRSLTSDARLDKRTQLDEVDANSDPCATGKLGQDGSQSIHPPHLPRSRPPAAPGHSICTPWRNGRVSVASKFTDENGGGLGVRLQNGYQKRARQYRARECPDRRQNELTK